jgi:hypothetical protein
VRLVVLVLALVLASAASAGGSTTGALRGIVTAGKDRFSPRRSHGGLHDDT